jgi:hypothetical protein
MKTLKTRWRNLPWSEIAIHHGGVEEYYSEYWERDQRGKEITIQLIPSDAQIQGCNEPAYSVISGTPEPGFACCSHLAEIGD